MVGFHLTGHSKGIVVGITWHTDDKVDVGGLKHLIGLLSGTDLCEGGWIARAQLYIFVEYFLVNAPVILEHERIIGIGNNQHVEDAVCHQIDKRHILQIKLIPLLRDIIGLAHKYLCF